MAKFIKHESCPSCGSRDNLGRYSDGSAFCFGCHYTERSNKSPFVGERDGTNERDSSNEGVAFPSDSQRHLDARAIEWLSKYDIGAGEALHAGLQWSPGWEQLLIPFYDGDGNLCCIQAKNFNPKRASKAKYYNVGDKSESTTVYGTGDTIVLVEDAVSAMKIGRQTAAMPLLGTSIGRSKLASLRAHYSRLIVWLDADKWREGREIADAGKLLGFSTKTLLTEKDPKEYSNEDIQGFLL